MLAAMVEVAAERGMAEATVADVVALSGVSRRTFYEVFGDREDCFLAAFDDAIGRASERVLPAYQVSGRWRERIRSALMALLRFFDERPSTARVLVLESLGGGSKVLERRQRALRPIVAAIDGGRGDARAGLEPSPLTAEGLAGAVLAVIHARLLEGDGEPLVYLTNELMSMIVFAYLGPAQARRELEYPRPKRSERSERGAPDPLRDIEMRLTYRTVRVLMALAADPESSNRVLADRAGIADQGQISKLLVRLKGLGLITNMRDRLARGEANAWVLTEKGREVHGAIAYQTARV
jgi:AcrR family transcriptional regulator/DNA-binding MarR family transcriptional regulator